MRKSFRNKFGFLSVFKQQLAANDNYPLFRNNKLKQREMKAKTELIIYKGF